MNEKKIDIKTRIEKRFGIYVSLLTLERGGGGDDMKIKLVLLINGLSYFQINCLSPLNILFAVKINFVFLLFNKTQLE